MDISALAKDEETEPALPEEAEPAPDTDFDVAADALASELGVPSTPGFKRALKETVMACMGSDYSAEEKPAEDDGLALIFGKGK